MKKKVTLLCAVAAMGIAAAAGVSLQNRAQLSDLALANIEAIAAEEEGTPVSPCYTEGSGNFMNATWYIECDNRTSPEMIYPCATNERFGYRGTESLCTK